MRLGTSAAVFPILGVGSWSNIAAALSDTDASNAALLDIASSVTDFTDALELSGLNFDVPEDATLTGFEALIRARANDVQRTIYAQLESGAVAVGSVRSGSLSDGTYSFHRFGGPGDLWGATTLTPADVNDPAFALLVFAMESVGIASWNMEVDFAYLQVYFTLPFSKRLHHIGRNRRFGAGGVVDAIGGS